MQWVLVAVFAAGCAGSGAPGSMLGNCAAFDACGGDLEGEWTSIGACMPQEAELANPFGPAACDGVAHMNGIVRTGTLTFEAGGWLIDTSDLRSHARASVGAECLVAESLGAASPQSCEEILSRLTSLPGGVCLAQGTACECDYDLSGGSSRTGQYTVSGGQLTLSNGAITRRYCVRDGVLTIEWMGPEDVPVYERFRAAP